MGENKKFIFECNNHTNIDGLSLQKTKETEVKKMRNKKWKEKIVALSLAMATIVMLSGCAESCAKEKDKPNEAVQNLVVDLTEGGTVFYNDLGNGVFYMNGGYIKIETDDDCAYMEEISQTKYHIVDYFQNNTRAVGYGFTAGKLKDICYGDTEEEIIKTLEAEFGYATVEMKSIKNELGTWKKRQVPEYVETYKGEDGEILERTSCVDIYYQLKDDMLYMVYIFADEESVDAEKIFDEMTLSKTAQVVYKNENPVKDAEDETSYVIRDIRGDVYEIHVPDEIAKGVYDEEPLYSSFRTSDTFVTMHVTDEKQEIKGNYEKVYEGTEEKTITYDVFTNADGNEVEYEHCIVDYNGIKQSSIRCQILQSGKYYVLDFSCYYEIENVEEYLKGYYVK